MRNTLAAAIFMLCVSSAFGQTASDIELKYGKPVSSYSVSEHIWMTADYAVDGQVCQMRLYPKRIAPDTNYLTQKLPFEELTAVLNRLVPSNDRGGKKETFGITATGGGASWTTYAYEKVTFVFASSLRLDPDSEKGLQPYTFLVPETLNDAQSENTKLSEFDFSRSKGSDAEIVTIKWNDRKCVNK
jgi:hypothetical protein